MLLAHRRQAGEKIVTRDGATSFVPHGGYRGGPTAPGNCFGDDGAPGREHTQRTHGHSAMSTRSRFGSRWRGGSATALVRRWMCSSTTARYFA
jgi:hypothetical protein